MGRIIHWVLGCMLIAGYPLDAASLDHYLPIPDRAQGWQFDVEPTRYTEENLFEYINGEAELYHDYGFVEMITAAYVRGEEYSFTYSVDIYHMGSPLNSFGIYSSYRHPGANLMDLGAEATVSELNLRFYKGPFFVQINAGSLAPELHALMIETARWIAEQMPASTRPMELGFLPAADQIESSLKYITRGFLGQSVFPAGLTALYDAGSDTLQAFVVLTKTAAEAERAFQVYGSHLRTRGKELAAAPGEVEADIPHQGRVLAVRHLHWIVGCIGHQERRSADTLIGHLLTALGE